MINIWNEIEFFEVSQQRQILVPDKEDSYLIWGQSRHKQTTKNSKGSRDSTDKDDEKVDQRNNGEGEKIKLKTTIK